MLDYIYEIYFFFILPSRDWFAWKRNPLFISSRYLVRLTLTTCSNSALVLSRMLGLATPTIPALLYIMSNLPYLEIAWLTAFSTSVSFFEKPDSKSGTLLKQNVNEHQNWPVRQYLRAECPSKCDSHPWKRLFLQAHLQLHCPSGEHE